MWGNKVKINWLAELFPNIHSFLSVCIMKQVLEILHIKKTEGQLGKSVTAAVAARHRHHAAEKRE